MVFSFTYKKAVKLEISSKASLLPISRYYLRLLDIICTSSFFTSKWKYWILSIFCSTIVELLILMSCLSNMLQNINKITNRVKIIIHKYILFFYGSRSIFNRLYKKSFNTPNVSLSRQNYCFDLNEVYHGGSFKPI